ncbi:MAG: AMP-binding protein [Proteobacteria bacterium]|nr:AMP-binding protein [Pseudomonadota bacterium]
MSVQMPGSLNDGATVADLYRGAFRAFGEREALVGGGVRLSYAQLAAQCHRMVRCFQNAGLKPQDRLVVLSGNRPACVAVQVAAALMGLSYTPLHPMGSQQDHAFVLRDLGARALVVDELQHAERGLALAGEGTGAQVFTMGPADFGTDLMAASAACDDSETPLRSSLQDVVRIVYSGGTTGQPKGIVHQHRTTVTTAMQQLATWEWPERVRYLATTPISHAAGALIITTFLQGGTVFLLDKYTPQACLALIEQEKINTTFMVPTQIYGLLDSPELAHHDTASLTLVLYGAAPMAPARLRQALQTFGPIFAQVYAQSEAPMTVCYLRRDEHDLARPHLLASCGRAVAGNVVKLLDADLNEVPVGEVGELCLRGTLPMAGYLNRPEETEKTFAGGWLHTGDMGRMDAQGFVYLVDRTKDMIISGGFNVYSTEVEACLALHPAVAQAAVIGVPHEKWGEAVLGVVILHVGHSVQAEALMAFVAQHKGVVIAPKFIEFVSELPMTPLGKVDKKHLRSRYWQGQERQIG